MDLDAYSVAVRIHLVEDVTRGLSMMGRYFATTDAQAKVLEDRLKSIGKQAMVGAGLMAGGAFGLHMLKGPIEEAKKYQLEMAKLHAQGVGDYQLAQADKFARAQNIMGASTRDTLKMVGEANSVLRDMGEAMDVAPRLLRMKYGMETVMQSKGYGEGHGSSASDQFMAALKTAELRGALVDPATQKFSEARFNQTLDFMTRAYTASGGMVKPIDYLAMIKTGGIAAKNLNDQAFYFGLMHMMQESGGSRTGTSLMSGFQNLYMGRTSQQVAELMAKDGLLDKSMIHYGKTGHITKLDPGAITQAELFRTNQFAYMNQVMLPLLHAQGIQDGAPMEIAIGKHFSNRTAGNLWTTMYRERANIAKHMTAAGGAMGVDDLAKAAGKTALGKEVDLLAKEAALKLQIGEVILPMYVKALEKTRDLLLGISGFATKNPAAFKAIIGVFAAVSAMAVASGGLMILTAGFKTLAFLSPVMTGFGGLLIRLAPIAMTVLTDLATGLAIFVSDAIALVAAMGPVGWTLMAVGAAAAYVYTHWGQLKPMLDQFTHWIGGIVDKLGGLHPIDSIEHALGFGNTVKPGSAPVQVKTSVHLDGRKVAEVVSDHQTRAANRPNTGTSGFNPAYTRPSPAGR